MVTIRQCWPARTNSTRAAMSLRVLAGDEGGPGARGAGRAERSCAGVALSVSCLRHVSGLRCGAGRDCGHTQLSLTTITAASLFAIVGRSIGGQTGGWRGWAAGGVLELHAAAEEEIFYPELLQVGLAARRATGVEEETLDATTTTTRSGTRSRGAGISRTTAGTPDHRANLPTATHAERSRGPDDFRPPGRAAAPARPRRRVRRLRGAELRGCPGVDKDPATYVAR